MVLSSTWQAATTDVTLGHQGLSLDAETGLYYNRARMLHPTLGTFTSRDPLGYVDGASLYEYVRGRPITGQDPTGLYYWKLFTYGLALGNAGIACYEAKKCWECYRTLDAMLVKARAAGNEQFVKVTLAGKPCGDICAGAGKDGLKAALWFATRWAEFLVR
jgi:RHS repeat-associated protein